MHTAHVNIGSNLGDSHLLVGAAVARICQLHPGARVSAPVESDPWGFASQRRFVNVGVQFPTPLEPLPLLRQMRQIEREAASECLAAGNAHRNADGTYRDRFLDIDLIFVDDLIMGTPELTLPHPRAHLRPFVLLPLGELAPGWVHPRLHLDPAQMLEMLSGK